MGAAKSVPESSIHEFVVKDYRGKDVDLSIYKGKVLLVVNVASKCWTEGVNFKQLTKLHNRLKDQDFEILAFPCDQFKQEPLSSLEVYDFACTKYNSRYPVFQKVRVNGPHTAPIYKFLKSKKSTTVGPFIKWNFTKFLIDREGRVVNRYWTYTFPLSIEEDIRKILEEV